MPSKTDGRAESRPHRSSFRALALPIVYPIRFGVAIGRAQSSGLTVRQAMSLALGWRTSDDVKNKASDAQCDGRDTAAGNVYWRPIAALAASTAGCASADAPLTFVPPEHWRSQWHTCVPVMHRVAPLDLPG